MSENAKFRCKNTLIHPNPLPGFYERPGRKLGVKILNSLDKISGYSHFFGFTELANNVCQPKYVENSPWCFAGMAFAKTQPDEVSTKSLVRNFFGAVT